MTWIKIIILYAVILLYRIENIFNLLDGRCYLINFFIHSSITIDIIIIHKNIW